MPGSPKDQPANQSKQVVRSQAAQRRPTMGDVARLAGVGTMTVSRVLNGTARVSADTAERVQTAIDQLRYRPNELARAFRGQRSRTIGLIVPYLNDPFFASCAHAVTTTAKERGYSVVITTSNEDAETEFVEAERMLQRHVDGIAVIPSRSRQSRLTRALFGKTPVVAFDRPVSDPGIDVVLVQNTAGSYRIVEHLIEHGHRQITFMGLSRRLFTINARFAGYSRALLRAGIQESSFFGCDSPEDTLRAIKELLAGKTPPSAFVTSNTLATLHVFSSLLSLGVKVPSEIAFVGFDDFELAALTAPPLTVVRQPAQGMGRVAAELLFDRIDAGEVPPVGNRIVLPVEMVLRRSCGCKHRTEVVIPLSSGAATTA